MPGLTFLKNLCLEMGKKEWKNSTFIIQEKGKEREENKQKRGNGKKNTRGVGWLCSAWVQFDRAPEPKTNPGQTQSHTQAARAKTWSRQLHPGRSFPTATGKQDRRTAGSRPKGRAPGSRAACGRPPAPGPRPARARRERVPRKSRPLSRESGAGRAPPAGPRTASLCRAAAEARPAARCAPQPQLEGSRRQHGEGRAASSSGGRGSRNRLRRRFLRGQKSQKISGSLNLRSEKRLILGTKALGLPSWAAPANLVVTALLTLAFH